MRRVILFEMVSIDGRFQGPRGWDIDWFARTISPDATEFCVEMERGAGALLLGRKTYDGFAAYWPTAKGPEAPLMNGLPKIVFSRTLKRVNWAHSILARGSPGTVVRRLKRSKGKDLFIFGSRTLGTTLRNLGLVDEYWIWVCPVVLGPGKPLFEPNARPIRMALLGVRQFRSGGVLLRYRPTGSKINGGR
jgi:dihydrofolate reductase